MITCKIRRRALNELSDIVFASDYIVLEDLKYGQILWIHVKDIKQLREMCVYKKWWYGYIPFFKNKLDKTKFIVYFSDARYQFQVENVDVIQFLQEVKLAREITSKDTP